MKLSRLSGRKRCDYVLRKGNKWRGKHFAVHWFRGAPKHKSEPPFPPGVYIGVTTSAKLHKSAVKRNRMRRRIREAFRVHLKSHDESSAQLLVRPHSSSLTCAFEEINRDVSSFFSALTRG